MSIDPDATVASAVALMHQGRPGCDAAVLERLFQALSVDPERAKTHVAMARFLLSIGEMDAGWREYEWANRLGEVRSKLPTWSGQRPPPGSRILVFQTGGAGDVIQFGRYLPLVANIWDEVVFLTTPELASLFVGKHPRVRIVTSVSDIPATIMLCRLLGLPALYWHSHGHFVSGMERMFASRTQCPALSDRTLRVGVCWRGNPRHEADAFRSMLFDDIIPLLSTSDCDFYSLQKDMTDAESAAFRSNVPDLRDWGATAAIIQGLNLVISVDTAVCHMAATLGVPTWVLLPVAAEWRWGRTGRDCPWYPSARLWRQTYGGGGWKAVVAEVKQTLAERRIFR